MAKLIVDEKGFEVIEGTILLEVCLANGIYIPNLCFIPGTGNPDASCRLCFVEIEGEPRTSCTVRVKDGMVVKTDSPLIRRLQRSALQLLLSVHDVSCASCPANKQCELQNIAKFLKIGLKPKHFRQRLKEIPSLDDHPYLIYHPDRCILCGKCVHVCQKKQGRPHLTFAKRGLNTLISFYGEETGDPLLHPCLNCSACVEICPVMALTSNKRENLTEYSASQTQHESSLL